MPRAFQTNAFQSTYPGNTAFQGFARPVFIKKAGLSNLYRAVPRIKRGGIIPIIAAIVDPLAEPALAFNPNSVEVTIIDSAGTLVIDAAQMSARAEEGDYIYLFQSSVGDILGYYTIFIEAADGGNTDIIERAIAFELV